MRRLAFVGALSVLMTLNFACRRDRGEEKGAANSKPIAPAPSEASAAPSGASAAQASGLIIRVLQGDSDAGMAAVVNLLESTGEARWIADVDDSGVARLAQACAAGERLEAKPMVVDFLHVAPQPCAAAVTFRFYTTQATDQLVVLAARHEKVGRYAAAQAAYGRAADRLEYSEPQKADRLRGLATRNVGRILGVERATLRVNGKDRLAPKMIDRLKAYQRRVRIPQTGVIDEATRDALYKDSLEGPAK
jgi:hypothetical protein